MKFEDLKGSFTFSIKPGYILVGGDEFLLSTSYNLIIKYAQIGVPDLNIIKFSKVKFFS